jgi:hypothetical protein
LGSGSTRYGFWLGAPCSSADIKSLLGIIHIGKQNVIEKKLVRSVATRYDRKFFFKYGG